MTGLPFAVGRPRPRFLDAWAAGPVNPVVVDREVHTWRIPLGGTPPNVSSLTSDERRRASGFLRRRDGERWAKSRIAVRGILGRYLHVAPSEVRFELGRRGKPRLADSDLQYNLTHSFDLAICAVGHMDLGVDVEKIREAPMAAGIAAGIVSADGPIHPGEGGAELDWAFFQAWTRVEAALKATGEGLAAIDRRPRSWIRGLAEGGQRTVDGRPLYLVDLPVDEGYSAALAIGGDAATGVIRCWTWTG